MKRNNAFSFFFPATMSSSIGIIKRKRKDEVQSQLPPERDMSRLSIKERAKNRDETIPSVIATDLSDFINDLNYGLKTRIVLPLKDFNG